MELVLQIIGWLGTCLIVLAYALVQFAKINQRSKIYQTMNLLGALCVGVDVFHQRAWPAFALQVVWGIIAVIALGKSRKPIDDKVSPKE